MAAPFTLPADPPVEAPQPEPVAEPAAAPSPEPAPSGEEAEAPASGIDLREVLKTASPAELRVLLDSVPEETRAEVVGEIEARGEQRAKTRKQETDTAKTDRMAAWKPWVDNLPSAQAYVNQQLANLKAGGVLDNPDVFEKATNHLSVGTLGKVVLENEAYVPELVDKYLPDLTKDEAAKLDKPLYRFGQTGMAKEAVATIFEMAVERARNEAFEAGVKKGEGSLQAKESLIDKLSKAQEIRQQAPGVSPNGKPFTSADERSRLAAEIASFDPTKLPMAEATAKLKELQEKERRLRS